MAEEERIYTPAEICAWFEITRTTLFRWEDSGEVPKAERGPQGERLYTKEHLQQIAKVVLRKMREDLELAVRQNPDSEVLTKGFLERLYKVEYFGMNPERKENKPAPASVLHTLEGSGKKFGLSDSTVDSLIDEARKRPRGDPKAIKIWRLLANYYSK